MRIKKERRKSKRDPKVFQYNKGRNEIGTGEKKQNIIKLSISKCHNER